MACGKGDVRQAGCARVELAFPPRYLSRYLRRSEATATEYIYVRLVGADNLEDATGIVMPGGMRPVAEYDTTKPPPFSIASFPQHQTAKVPLYLISAYHCRSSYSSSSSSEHGELKISRKHE